VVEVERTPLSAAEQEVMDGLRKYFQLQFSLVELIKDWSQQDPHMAKVC
jgi:hypothetical protein